MSTTLYTAVATATSGRDGKVFTADKRIELPLSVPKTVGGPGGEGTNPEELFAMGYAACYGSALKLVAGMAKQKTADIQITGRVHLQKTDDGGFGIAVELEGHLPSIPKALAEELMHKAHQVCPYSKATRNNIEVKLSVVESLP
jgi:osmotically inducible protein OsmC